MINIKAMLKSGILLVLHLNKVLYKGAFWHCKWLGDYNVISVREQTESKLYEV